VTLRLHRLERRQYLRRPHLLFVRRDLERIFDYRQAAVAGALGS
jgi:hypothetical protein